jgi:cystathionine gamma-synthase
MVRGRSRDQRSACATGKESWSQKTNPLVVPLYHTSVFTYPSSDELIEFNERKGRDRLLRDADYGRYSNPTEQAVEDALAELEGADAALLYPSGMAAVTATLLALTLSFDEPIHLIIGAEGYRKTREFADKDLARLGATVTYVAPNDLRSLRDFIRPTTRIIFLESPTNPYLRVTDLEDFARIGSEYDIKTVVDATFASPINQKPLSFGIDLVVHSATKYLGGHNDLIAGVVAGRHSSVAPLRERRGIAGTIASPDVAHRLLRSLPELELRVQRQNSTALEVAQFLERHESVERVWYPGLASHPEYDIARHQLSGFGGVVSFEVRGGLNDAASFIDRLTVPYLGASFGGVDPLIEQPAVISYYLHGEARRRELGIKDNLVRLSVGLVSPQVLIDDLSQALAPLMRRRIEVA